MKFFIVLLFSLFIVGCQIQGPIPFKPPSGLGDRVFEPANPIKRVAPKYPRHALIESIEGFVVVEFQVNEKGVAEHIKVVQSYPEKYFVKVVMRALKQWTFEPEQSGMTYRNIFNFRLAEAPKAP
jgi:TonB family protein